MPQPLIQPPGGPGQSPLGNVPYPAAAGAAGPTVQLGSYSAAQVVHPLAVQMQQYTGDWLEIINLSDSLLQPVWDIGTQLPPIPQGFAWAAPVPNGVNSLNTTILSQTTTQQFPQEILIATYYTAQELAAGFRPREGPLVPSVPAASIGAGTLPAGVLIPANQVLTGTFRTGTYAFTVSAATTADIDSIRLGRTGVGADQVNIGIDSSLGGLFFFDVATNQFIGFIDRNGRIYTNAVPQLRATFQDLGICGIGADVALGTDKLYQGVSFHAHLSNVPTSVTLTTVDQNNVASVAADNITLDGFRLVVTPTAAGDCRWFGNYATVGN